MVAPLGGDAFRVGYQNAMETLLASYGLWIVLLATLLDQLGAPVPAPPTLVLAGSLTHFLGVLWYAT